VVRFVEDPAASLDRFDAQPACEDHDTAGRASAQSKIGFFTCPRREISVLRCVGPERADSMMHRTEHQTMLDLMPTLLRRTFMRTTVTLDDTLIEKARKLTGIEERSALLHEAIRALIARESASRLARLGGSEPQLRAVPRRRSANR